jgi:hypothetical protein
MSTKELQRLSDVQRVLKLIASGEARSVSEACRIANVPRSTYYEHLRLGVFDEMLARMEQDILTEVVSAFSTTLPKLLEAIEKDALDDSLTARDRDTARRTYLLYKDKLAGSVSPAATGEAATDWLKRQGSRFQPIQIVGSQVVIHSGEEPEIVDGELEEG